MYCIVLYCTLVLFSNSFINICKVKTRDVLVQFNGNITQVYWHSSAHILGEALERHVGGCLCYGPPIENGFYYDTYLGEQYVLYCRGLI